VTRVEPEPSAPNGTPRPPEGRTGLLETIESDPLGLVTHRHGEDGPPPSPDTARAELLKLLLALAAIVGLGFAAGYGETVLVVLALIGCIVAHEAGHFVAARSGGVKVTEFFVGFGPRVWSVHRGETEYGVKALPLGGYCRIIGMNNLDPVEPADEPRTYRAASLGRRLLIDVAGSATHFLIAIVILFAMFFWTGDNGNYLTRVPATNPIISISALTTGQSPAQKAGFRVGDRIVAIDGKAFDNWQSMGEYIRSHPGVRLDVTVRRAGQTIHLYPAPVDLSKVSVVGQGSPVAGSGSGSGPVGFIGIGISPVVHSALGPSIAAAGGAFASTITGTFHALGNLVSFHGISSYFHMLTSQKTADNSQSSVRFESPVGVVRIINQASQDGLATVLWIVAVINIFIGIFNLLPIFPLDGARIVVALYEGVRSRRRQYRVDMAKLLPVMYLGLGLVLFIGISSLFLDLRDLAV
jgi:membrane-associated protease RseP (regulator of RpoE activity)